MFKLSFISDPPSTMGDFSEFQRLLDHLAELGYHGCEFSLPTPPGFDSAALRRALDDTGLAMVSFLTGWSYFHDGLALSSPDAAVRRRAVERLNSQVEIAREFGALLVVGQMQGFRSDEPDPHVANERIVDCLRQVADKAQGDGVTLVVEPVNHLQVGFNHTVGEVLHLIERVGSPAIKPMVDTLHMNIEEESILEPIRRVGTDLAHVHLCETNGGPFGSAHLDFASAIGVLHEIGYDEFVSVKIYRLMDPWSASAQAIEFLKNLQAVS